MVPNISKNSIYAVLPPRKWTCICKLEDPYADPVYFYHHMYMHLEAARFNTAPVEIWVEDSADEINWRTIYRHPAQLVPNGFVNFNTPHVFRWVRVILWCVAPAVVMGRRMMPEPQALPNCVWQVEADKAPPEPVDSDPVDVKIEGGDTAPGYQKPCTLGYRFEAQLDWDPIEWCIPVGQALIVIDPLPNGDGDEWCFNLYPDLDLYVREQNADEVVYSGHPAGVDLALNHNAFANCEGLLEPPEVIAGGYSVANTFRVWYNQPNDCAPELEGGPTVQRVVVTNTGTCIVIVNGEDLLPGEAWTLDGLAYAGYATGDMSAWLGGVPVVV